jgi:nitroreductase
MISATAARALTLEIETMTSHTEAIPLSNDSANSVGPSTIDFLLRRASAVRLAEPGPTREQIDIILKAAVTAADHGRIRPWRFVVMQGDGRKRLANLMAEEQHAANPEISEADLEKTRAKAMRAPVVIALACKANASHKVQVFEQQLAVAAAGAHLMLAANALGFGANWRTGAAAYHPIVRKGLGFGADDAIIGFFYIGTNPQPSPMPRASIESVVQYWRD